MKKNVAGQSVSFQATHITTGAAVTAGTPTVYVTIEGTRATGTGTSTHKGNGEWAYVPTQAETNGDEVAFTFTLTSAINQTVNTFPDNVDADLANVQRKVDDSTAILDGPITAKLWRIVLDIPNVAQPTIIVSDESEDEWHIAYKTDNDSSVWFATYTVSTHTLTTPILINGSGNDCKIIYRSLGVLYYIRLNGTGCYRYISTDQGLTWGSPLEIMTAVTRWEDTRVLILPDGDLLVTAEDEHADKGDSDIYGVKHNLVTGWGTKIAYIEDAFDNECPMTAIDDNGDTVMLVPSNKSGGVTYDDNEIFLYRSTDNLDTIDSGTLFLSQKSHVEAEIKKLGGVWLLSSTRGFGASGIKGPLGVHIIGTTLVPKRLIDGGWTQEQGQAIVSYGGVSVWDMDTNERGFLSRSLANTADFQIEVEDCTGSGSAGTDFRVGFAGTDFDNHYIFLVQSTSGNVQFYKRVAGLYTLLNTTAFGPDPNTLYKLRVEFDGVGKTQKLYIDDVLISDNADTDATLSGGGPWMCLGCSNGGTQLPAEFGRVTVTKLSDGSPDWVETWKDYAYFITLGPQLANSFAGRAFISNGKVIIPVEDRVNDRILAYELTVDALTQAEVKTQADAALLEYDGPTRAEATADQQAVMAKLTKPIKIWNNPQRANHIEIIRGDAYDGDGTPGSAHLKFSWDFGKDITGKAFTMTIRGEDDEKTDTAFMVVTGVGAGQLAVPSIPSSKTINLPITNEDTKLIFDLEVTHAADSKESQVGTVTVAKDAT